MTAQCSTARGSLPKALHRFTAGGALAVALVAGAVSSGALAYGDSAVQRVDTELAKGHLDKAIAIAEGAVSASQRDAALRAALGHAYLRAGRFDSAASALGDAVALGDNSARTALSLALADIATDHPNDAVHVLDQARDGIPAADFGLAMALAGETGRGVTVLTDALRQGNQSPKLRENLAYAYALDGRWDDARLMATFDVPANQIDARLQQWAHSAGPNGGHERVAALLGVPQQADPGMPALLALADVPAAKTGAALADAAPAAKPDASGELPALAGPAPAAPMVAAAQPAPAPAVAVAEPAPAAPAPAPAIAMVSQAVVEPLPAAPAKAPVAHERMASFAGLPAPTAPADKLRRGHPAPLRLASAPVTHATHMVQLGSFSSAENAARAKQYFLAHDAALRGHDFVISQASVNGHNFWRVAASGFDGAGASGVCSSLKRRGNACMAYAVGRAPAGEALAMAGPALGRNR